MPALLELTPWAATLWGVALGLIALAVVKGLFGPLATLPGFGGAIRSLIDTIVHALLNTVGTAIRGPQKLVGASLHHLSRYLDWTWEELQKHSNLIVALASPIGALLLAYAGVRAAVRHLSHTGAHSDARLKQLTRRLHGIDRELKHLERDLSKGIGEDVLPRIRHLDREVGRLEHRTIPAIRAAERANEGAIGNLWEWVKDNVALPRTAAFTAAVAYALARLGLDLFKCNEAKSLYNKRGCGMWNDLDALLGVAFIPLAIASLPELIKVAQAVTEDVVKAAETVLDV